MKKRSWRFGGEEGSGEAAIARHADATGDLETRSRLRAVLAKLASGVPVPEPGPVRAKQR